MTLYENRHNIKNPKPTKFPRIAILVPAFNEEGRIKRTINSLLKLDYPKDKLKIIMIDDGSTDNTLKEMRSYNDKRISVFTKKNGGKGSALNFGLKKTNAEFVASLDADSFVMKDTLKKMIGYFERPKVMAVTPSLKVWKPKNILQKIQHIEYLMGVFLRKIFSFLGSIHVTPGPFTVYRKKFFDKHGGYDEDNITEDIEIALRIQSNHYEIENSVDAFSYTPGVPGFRALFKQRIRWYKGFIDNILNYRHLFSKKYGNLGLFVLPASYLSIVLLIILVIYGTTKLLINGASTLSNWYSIRFDLFQLFEKPELFFMGSDNIFLMSLLSIAIAIVVLYVTKLISNEQTKIKTYYVYHLFLYGPLFTIWWLTSFFYKLRGIKVKWAGEEWEKE
ncbi:glycosyltransferase [Nanoarchaeota archaeon]